MLCYNVATHLLFTDPCESSPCKNGGKCISGNGEWTCDCTSQYFGLNCEYERNPCQYIKCLNGGTCLPTMDFTNYTCSCSKGFQGVLCQEEVNKRGIFCIPFTVQNLPDTRKYDWTDVL